ncbi:MAG: hypothetical protein J6Y80_03700, partial [Victivallales bacterium]|nr:hypothetical protein [Victivallales bacterium]
MPVEGKHLNIYPFKRDGEPLAGFFPAARYFAIRQFFSVRRKAFLYFGAEMPSRGRNSFGTEVQGTAENLKRNTLPQGICL